MMDKVFAALTVAVLAIAAYVVLVMVPVALYADAECLRHGYPRAYVTVGLERYCSNFDGAVTVKVTKQ